MLLINPTGDYILQLRLSPTVVLTSEGLFK